MTESFDLLQQWLFEAVFQPVMLQLGMTNLLEAGYMAAAWFMLGCIQVMVIAAVIVPLQRWRPVEPVTNPRTIRLDFFYTLIHRLGVFRLVMFLLFQSWLDEAFGWMRASEWSWGTLHLDQIFPSLTEIWLVSLLLYLIVFDFFDYWIHRAQHSLRAWWALHSLHHAQTQMTCWSDNRNHLLDDAFRDVLLSLVAFMIGVSPAQFVMIVVLTQLSESLQHANFRLPLGPIAERLWVSPAFHRRHHSIAHGLGHNFGVLLPWWDALFGTAQFEHVKGLQQAPCGPTGVDGPTSHYGDTFLSQQWLGLVRLVRSWR